jgi:hypothetical protein
MKSDKLKTGATIYTVDSKGQRLEGTVVDRWLDHLSVVFTNGRFRNVHCKRVSFAKIKRKIVEVNFHSRVKK